MSALSIAPTAIDLIKNGNDKAVEHVLAELAISEFKKKWTGRFGPLSVALTNYGLNMKKAVDNAVDWSKYHDEYVDILRGLDRQILTLSAARNNSQNNLELLQPVLDSVNKELKACR